MAAEIAGQAARPRRRPGSAAGHRTEV